MYRIGFIDDSNSLFEVYETLMEMEGIKLICTCEKMTMDEVVKWVLENRIQCLMVDYKLKPKYTFVGTDLIAYINRIFPDLPCIILTSYKQDSVEQKLVMTALIEDRNRLEEDDDKTFFLQLKNNVDVFVNRMDILSQKFKNLFNKRNVDGLNSKENEEFLNLYKILRSYGEVDDLPLEIFDSKVSDKLNDILERLDKILGD